MRLRQLLSVLESQYSGDTMLLVYPMSATRRQQFEGQERKILLFKRPQRRLLMGDSRINHSLFLFSQALWQDIFLHVALPAAIDFGHEYCWRLLVFPDEMVQATRRQQLQDQ